MKKVIFCLVCALSCISVSDSDVVALKTITKNAGIEVMIVGHYGDKLLFSRDGTTYKVLMSDLKMTSELKHKIRQLDADKKLASEVYAKGKRISEASTNKTCFDVMNAQDELETIQEKVKK